MKIKFKQDLVGGIVFLIVSLVIWFMMPSQIKINTTDTINSQSFPRVIIGLMMVCSIYLIIVQVIKIIKKIPVKEVEIDLKQEGKCVLMIGMIAAYWLMLHFLTFMAASLIFAGAILVFFKCKNWKYYGIVFTSIIVITLVFQNLLGVKLP